MTKIVKLQKMQNRCPVNELRKLFDHISSHVQSLITLGIQTEHNGTLVIPIILGKLSDEIGLVISRKSETNNCCVDDVLDLSKHEIAARENCDVLNRHSENNKKKITNNVVSLLVHC